MARLDDLEVYEGIHELIWALHAMDVSMAIVTKSPGMVPKRFVELHKWPVATVIGFHDVKRHKPDPEALLLALGGVGKDPVADFHVGDRAEDTEAARAAGITSIGAGWGIADIGELQASAPDYLFVSVDELERFFFRTFTKSEPPQC